jgi:hypothetical protein
MIRLIFAFFALIGVLFVIAGVGRGLLSLPCRREAARLPQT